MTTPPQVLGVIVPSVNTVLERDLPRLPLPGVQFSFTRIRNAEDTEEQLAAMKDAAAGAASLLADARGCSAIAFACTGGSFLHGLGYDRQVVELMQAEVSVPCVTTSGSVVAALQALKIKRPQMFAPYPEWLARRGEQFLVRSGFEVQGLHWGFPIPRTLGTDDVEPIREWVLNTDRSQADGIFISCTNFSWLRGIAALEQATGLPVITSNQATVHGLLKAAGLSTRAEGYGTLLQ